MSPFCQHHSSDVFSPQTASIIFSRQLLLSFVSLSCNVVCNTFFMDDTLLHPRQKRKKNEVVFVIPSFVDTFVIDIISLLWWERRLRVGICGCHPVNIPGNNVASNDCLNLQWKEERFQTWNSTLNGCSTTWN